MGAIEKGLRGDMARPKAFDRDLVLERAIALFWRRGYSATSVAQLVAETGINRGSLYDTYGGKHALFLAAIEHYSAAQRARMGALLEKPGLKLAALRHLFESIAEQFRNGRPMCGCLVTNSAVELAPHDADVRVRVAAHLGQVEEMLFDVLEAAAAAGELAPQQDCRALAQYFVSCLQGLAVMSKTAREPEALGATIDIALGALSSPMTPNQSSQRGEQA